MESNDYPFFNSMISTNQETVCNFSQLWNPLTLILWSSSVEFLLLYFTNYESNLYSCVIPLLSVHKYNCLKMLNQSGTYPMLVLINKLHSILIDPTKIMQIINYTYFCLNKVLKYILTLFC